MDLREVVCSGVIDGLVSKQEAAWRSEAVGNRGCVEPLVSLTAQLTPHALSSLHSPCSIRSERLRVSTETF